MSIKLKKPLSFLLAVVMVLSLLPAMAIPALAADPGISKAVITDDSGSEVDLTGGTSDSAAFSWADNSSKNYNMSMTLAIPEKATDISFNILLGQGMAWQDDGSTNSTLTGRLNGGTAGITKTLNSGSVTGSDGTAISVDTAGTGARTYSIKNGTQGVTVPVIVKLDTQFHYTSLPGGGTTTNSKVPVTATLTYTPDGGGTPVTDTVTLDSATVSDVVTNYWSGRSGSRNNVVVAAGATTELSVVAQAEYYRLCNAPVKSSDILATQKVEKIEVTANFTSTYDVALSTSSAGWNVTGGSNAYTMTRNVNGSFHSELLSLKVTPEASTPAGTAIPTSWTVTTYYYGNPTPTTSTITYSLVVAPATEAVYLH